MNWRQRQQRQQRRQQEHFYADGEMATLLTIGRLGAFSGFCYEWIWFNEYATKCIPASWARSISIFFPSLSSNTTRLGERFQFSILGIVDKINNPKHVTIPEVGQNFFVVLLLSFRFPFAQLLRIFYCHLRKSNIWINWVTIFRTFSKIHFV